MSASNASPNPCPGGGNCVVKFKLADGSLLALPSFDWSLVPHIALPSLPRKPSSWVYISTYAPADPVPGTANWKVLSNEVIRMKLDGFGTQRLAHHYSRPAGENYNWTPRASIDPGGTKVLFNSNFGLQHKVTPAPPSTYADVYMITAP